MPRNWRAAARLRIAPACLASTVLLGSPAQAHEFIPGVTGFPALMLHPVFLTHQLACIVLAGLAAGRTQSVAAWGFLPAFAVGLVAGQWLSSAAPSLFWYFWHMTLVVILAASATVAAFGRLPALVSIPIVALLGAVIGLDTQGEGPAFSDMAQAAAATFLTGALIILAIGSLVSRPLPQWADVLVRVVAAWIAASSLMALALLMRG
ncbi:MAG: HupE/UreJ family protein [Rhodomicrobiaceae bacterium]